MPNQNVRLFLEKSNSLILNKNTKARAQLIHKSKRAKTVRSVKTNDNKNFKNINNIININNQAKRSVNLIHNNINYASESELPNETKLVKSKLNDSNLSSENYFTEQEKKFKSNFYFDIISIMTTSSRHW